MTPADRRKMLALEGNFHRGGVQAGWGLGTLPPRSPELNPVENVWLVMRDNSLDAPTHSDTLDLDGIDPFNAEMCRRGVEFMRGEGFGELPADGDLLIFDNWRMLHARDSYEDPERHLTRYWVG